MKNLANKLLLLPITTTTLLVPISLVSCKDNYVEPIKQVELKDGYDPAAHGITQHDGGGYWDPTALTSEYIKKAQQNPKIFQNDMLNGFCEAGYVEAFADALTQYDNLDSIKFGVTKPKFGSTTAWEWGTEDSKYKTISFRSRLTLQYSHHTLDSKQWFKRTINLNVTYHDVIFYTYEVPNKWGWGIGLSDPNVLYESLWPYARNTKPWSINLDCSSVETITTKIDDNESAVIYKSSYYTEIIDTEAKLEAVLRELPQPNTNEMAKVEQLITETALFLGFDSYYLGQVDNYYNVKLREQLNGSYHGEIVEGNDITLKGLILLKPQSEKIRYKNSYLLWPEQHGEGNPPNPKDILFTEVGGGNEMTFNPASFEYVEGLWGVKLNGDSLDMPLIWSKVNMNNIVNEESTLSFLINQPSFRIRINYDVKSIDPSTGQEVWRPANRTVAVNLHYNTVNILWSH